MAQIPKNDYAGRVDTGDAGYPQGKAQDLTSPGDGTPLREGWINDIWGFLQSILDAASITPDGNPDKVGASQYLSGIIQIIADNVPESGSTYPFDPTKTATKTANYTVNASTDQAFKFTFDLTTAGSNLTVTLPLAASSPAPADGFFVALEVDNAADLYKITGEDANGLSQPLWDGDGLAVFVYSLEKDAYTVA